MEFYEYLRNISILYTILPIVIIITLTVMTIVMIIIERRIKYNKEYLNAIFEQLKNCQIQINTITEKIKK